MSASPRFSPDRLAADSVPLLRRSSAGWNCQTLLGLRQALAHPAEKRRLGTARGWCACRTAGVRRLRKSRRIRMHRLLTLPSGGATPLGLQLSRWSDCHHGQAHGAFRLHAGTVGHQKQSTATGTWNVQRHDRVLNLQAALFSRSEQGGAEVTLVTHIASMISSQPACEKSRTPSRILTKTISSLFFQSSLGDFGLPDEPIFPQAGKSRVPPTEIDDAAKSLVRVEELTTRSAPTRIADIAS